MSRKEGREERKKEKEQKVKKAKIWMLGKAGDYSMGNDLGDNMTNACIYLVIWQGI